MTFNDPQLEKHCDKVVSLMTRVPVELRPVIALLDAWHWFMLIEGRESPRVREAIEHLSASELRPALKAWYAKMPRGNPIIDEYRLTLEGVIGEQLPLGDDSPGS
jgi:hypothetical protein